jgi:hypothetical protein
MLDGAQTDRRRWGAGVAWPAGLVLFGLEAVQGVLLLPWLLRQMGAPGVAFWVALSSAVTLLSIATAPLPLTIRNIAAATEGDGHAPANWPQLHRRAVRDTFVLLMPALFLYGALVIAPQATGSDHAVATAVFAAALLLRLAALNAFVLVSGVQQVGRDKVWLATAAALTLLGSVVAALLTPDVTGLALAYLAGALALWAGSRHAVAQVPRARGSANADLPRPHEVRDLLLLQMAGFANLGTVVPLATLLLPEAEAVGSAFWFRACATVLAGAAFVAQVRMPAWAAAAPGSAAPREAGWLLGGVALLILLILGASSLHPPGVPVLAASATAALCLLALAGAVTVLVGQWLIARRAHAFVPLAVALAAGAPLASLAVAAFERPAWAWGHAIVNVVLAGAMLRHARAALR